MNDVKVTLRGNEYPLIFNGRAMFDLRETYETESDMLEAVSRQTGEGFDALCSVVQKLTEQAELVRRYEGYDPQEMLTVEQIGLTASPVDYISMKRAVMSAVVKGFGREIEEEEKDLGLAELEQKKTTGSRKRNTSR